MIEGVAEGRNSSYVKNPTKIYTRYISVTSAILAHWLGIICTSLCTDSQYQITNSVNIVRNDCYDNSFI